MGNRFLAVFVLCNCQMYQVGSIDNRKILLLDFLPLEGKLQPKWSTVLYISRTYVKQGLSRGEGAALPHLVCSMFDPPRGKIGH